MNNNTCSYCGSSLGGGVTTMIDKVYCGFCEIFVEPSVNGERLERYEKTEFIGYDQIRMPTSALLDMHTKSLLELLKFIREERRSYFETMRIMKKSASFDKSITPVEKESSEMYEFMTKKCFVVENILRDRMGYIPKKVTDNLILSYEQRIADPYNERSMNIKKPERELEKSEGIQR